MWRSMPLQACKGWCTTGGDRGADNWWRQGFRQLVATGAPTTGGDRGARCVRVGMGGQDGGAGADGRRGCRIGGLQKGGGTRLGRRVGSSARRRPPQATCAPRRWPAQQRSGVTETHAVLCNIFLFFFVAMSAQC